MNTALNSKKIEIQKGLIKKIVKMGKIPAINKKNHPREINLYLNILVSQKNSKVYRRPINRMNDIIDVPNKAIIFMINFLSY